MVGGGCGMWLWCGIVTNDPSAYFITQRQSHCRGRRQTKTNLCHRHTIKQQKRAVGHLSHSVGNHLKTYNSTRFQHDVYQNQKLAHWNHGVCMCMTTMDTGVHIPNIGWTGV